MKPIPKSGRNGRLEREKSMFDKLLIAMFLFDIALLLLVLLLA